MRNFLWLAIGVVIGVVAAGTTGIVIVNLLIPWEDICAVIGPAQRVADTGATLLVSLQDWLAKAESLLATGSSDQVTEQARSGLGGIVDRAEAIVIDVKDSAIDIVTAPLQRLIDLAQGVLSAVQAAVDAARDVVASVDEARCN